MWSNKGMRTGELLDPFWVGRRMHLFDQRCRLG
jgi:hypothetical protein